MTLDPIVLDEHVDHDGLGVAVVATAFEPNLADCAVCLSTVDVLAGTKGGPAVSLTPPQARRLARWLDKVADAWNRDSHDAPDEGRGVVLLLAVVALVLLVAGGVGGLLATVIPTVRDLTPTCVVPTAAGCEAGP